MNSRAAKKKLKLHLKKYKADENFVITESLVAYWCRVINRAVFQGKVDVHKIQIRGMRKFWGECDGWTIGINEQITNRELLISTIAHEMVHQWQWDNFGKMNHADTYLEWKKKFKKEFKIDL